MQFSSLSAEDQQRVQTQAARSALTGWGFGDADVALLAYRSNAVFEVSRDSLRAVLRIHRPGRKPRVWIESELAWLDDLSRNHSLPVPMPLAPAATIPLEGTDEEVICTLISRLDGAVVLATEFTTERALATGRIMAQIHEAGLQFAPGENFSRPRFSFDGLFGVESPYNPGPEGEALFSRSQRAVMEDVTARVARVFDSLERMGGQTGLIHADLKPDNLLFDSSNQPCVLDFDDCGWGYFLYDFAPLLLYLKPNRAYADLKAALWQGYRSQRQIPEALRGGLETLVAGRYAASCRWVAAYRDHPSYRGRAAEIIAGRVAELVGFLEMGTL